MSRINSVNAKRCVAVFMAVLMMILSLSYTSGNETDAANTTRKYYVYNAKTGSYKRQYNLNPVETYNNNTRAVIGNDERVIDWTKSGVVKIMNSTSYIGSGFVVGDHVIATAAHCAYNLQISEILLFDNSGNVTLHATPVEYHIPYNYCVNTNNKTFDYALITVKEDLSDYACFDLGVTLDSFADKHPVVTVTGFPGEVTINNQSKTVNTHTQHMMYSGNGIVTNKDSNDLLFYQSDTTGGNSGGSVYITESLKGTTYYTVVAIHAYGNPSTGNHGTSITTDLIHFYNDNSANINW